MRQSDSQPTCVRSFVRRLRFGLPTFQTLEEVSPSPFSLSVYPSVRPSVSAACRLRPTDSQTVSRCVRSFVRSFVRIKEGALRCGLLVSAGRIECASGPPTVPKRSVSEVSEVTDRPITESV